MLQKGLKVVSSSTLLCGALEVFTTPDVWKKKKKDKKKASKGNTSRHPGALEAVKLTPSRDKFAALGTSLKLVCFHSWSEFASVWQWSIAWEGAEGFGLRMDSQNLLPPSLLPFCFVRSCEAPNTSANPYVFPCLLPVPVGKKSHSFLFFQSSWNQTSLESPSKACISWDCSLQ